MQKEEKKEKISMLKEHENKEKEKERKKDSPYPKKEIKDRVVQKGCEFHREKFHTHAHLDLIV
jgi:hypothetical protein